MEKTLETINKDSGNNNNISDEDKKPPIFTLNTILKSGANFGHRKNLWNPKMKPYIYAVKEINDYNKTKVHILNIKEIRKQLEIAYDFLKDISDKGQDVLFVGTKPCLANLIEEIAVRSNSYYINYRWLGGTLTNIKTIRLQIRRMQNIEKMELNGNLEKLVKKEKLKIRKEYYKLKNIFQGIRKMSSLPSCLVVFDTIGDRIAIKEANKLNIPVVAIVDSNCNPEGIKYLIPGNDNGKKSILLFATILTDAICVGKKIGKNTFAYADEVSFDLEEKKE